MSCPNCGIQNAPGIKVCANCGVQLAAPVPTYARPVPANTWSRFSMYFTLALLIGLGVGGYLFWRTDPLRNAYHSTTSDSAEQTTTANTPAPSNKDKSLKDKPVEDKPAEVMPPEGEKHGAPAHPVRTSTEPTVVPAQESRNRSVTEQAPTVISSTPATRETSTKSGRAVQEPDNPTPDLPKPANTDGQPAVQVLPTDSPQSRPAPAPAIVPAPPQSSEPVKPAYTGANAGLATWTGKLERDGTLTITSGTPSSGVLTGSGLPGVPVRIIIDQTNLGFVEMPGAANGFKKLVLRSHGRHDKITIHWTVIQ